MTAGSLILPKTVFDFLNLIKGVHDDKGQSRNHATGYLATENCNFITIDWKVVQTSNVRVLNISNEAGLHLA